MNRPIAIPIPKSGTPQCPVSPAADNSPGSGGPGASIAGLVIGGRGYAVAVVPDVAPPAHPAGIHTPATCADTVVPSGMRAVPFYLNVSSDTEAGGSEPIDLRITSTDGPGTILVESAYGGPCHAATSVHAYTGGRNDPTVMRGLAIMPASPCPAQRIRIAGVQSTDTNAVAELRFYVPCT